ncbi:MAG: hypothetical protein PUP91_29830 [Rhizonema sp. PD37]|nr:hypothetical protein [Rhizonema sp. PD37]
MTIRTRCPQASAAIRIAFLCLRQQSQPIIRNVNLCLYDGLREKHHSGTNVLYMAQRQIQKP